MNKKKLLALLMALVMTLSLMPMTVIAEELETVTPIAEPAEAVAMESVSFEAMNEVAATDVAQIGTNGDKFATLNDAFNNASAGDTVYLLDDLDLGNTQWTPINTNGVNFDGQGHTISNLNVSQESAQYAGLFGQVTNATIQNVHLENVSITNGDDPKDQPTATYGGRFGAVVGLIVDGSINNCTVTNVTIQDMGHIGGIAGANKGSVTITNCTVNGNIYLASGANKGGGWDVGGILGKNQEGSVSITGCTVDGTNVTTSKIYSQYAAGGILGFVGGSITISGCVVKNIAVEASSNSVDLKEGNRVGAGGIVGSLKCGISNCIVNGVSVKYLDATTEGSFAAVGFIGAAPETNVNVAVSDCVVINSTASWGGQQMPKTQLDPERNNDDEPYTVTYTNTFYAVASINDTSYYPTLQAAIDAAQNGDTVKLLENIEIGAVSGKYDPAFSVCGKDITIDGNNKTITANGNGQGNVFKFCEDSNDDPAQCVLKNLTINSTGYQVDILAGGNDNFSNTLSIDNVHVTTGGEAVYASDIAEITATNSSFAQNGQYKTGMQEPYYAAATVGYAGILTLTDCEISAVSGSYAAAPFPSGGTINLNNTVVSGDLFAWIGNGDAYTPADSIININSGKVNGNYGYRVSEHRNGHIAQINVNGGVYTNSPANQEGVVIKEGYQVIANTAADTKDDYPLTVAQPVAEFNGTQYATLADAIAAANESGGTVTLLRDYDMEANEPGYGYTSSFLAQGESAARNNMIEIDDNVTFDLGNHTLSNLFNNVFTVTGDNVVVQNGTMRVGQLYYSNLTGTTIYTSENDKTCSYVMYVKDASYFVVNNLSTYGGINVTNSTATINDLQFSGTKFYAVCSQDGADVTINGGTYNKAIAGATSNMFMVDSGSSMKITGGRFEKGSTVSFFLVSGKDYIAPIVTGGVFNFNPSEIQNKNCVADGYEAVALTGENQGWWQVGKVTTTPPAKTETATDGFAATYTADKTVKATDGSNDILDTKNNITVNIKTIEEQVPIDASAAKDAAPLDNIKNMQDFVETVTSKTGDANEVNVTVQLDKSAGDTSVEGKVTYKVHPEAVITTTTGGNEVTTTVALTNDQITGSFTFKLYVGSLSSETVNVVHIHEDGTQENLGVFNVTDGYITLTNIRQFSDFEVSPVVLGSDSQETEFHFEGGSLRRRVKTINGVATDEVVSDYTDVRFTYTINHYVANEENVSYYFQWSKDENTWSKAIPVTNVDGQKQASLVITKVPYIWYGQKIYTRICKVAADGSITMSATYERTISQIANHFINNNTQYESRWVDYAKFLMGNNGVTAYTIARGDNDAIIGYYINNNGILKNNTDKG